MSDTGPLAATSANPLRRLEVRTVLAVLLAWFGAAGLIVEGRSQDLESDKQALIALYNATDGPNWNVNHGWLSDEPLDTWFVFSAAQSRKLERNPGGTAAIPCSRTSHRGCGSARSTRPWVHARKEGAEAAVSPVAHPPCIFSPAAQSSQPNADHDATHGVPELEIVARAVLVGIVAGHACG